MNGVALSLDCVSNLHVVSMGFADRAKKTTRPRKKIVDGAARLSTTPSTPTGGTPEAKKTAVTNKID